MIFVYSRVSYLTYVPLQISCRVPLKGLNFNYLGASFYNNYWSYVYTGSPDHKMRDLRQVHFLNTNFTAICSQNFELSA